MSDITTQSLTSLVNNIKEKKLSSEEVDAAIARVRSARELGPRARSWPLQAEVGGGLGELDL